MNNQETLPTKLSHGPIERWMAWSLVVTALLAGWFIPEFYDWTGADQSRPAPIIGWIGLTILIVDLLLIVLLVWFHFAESLSPSSKSNGRRRMRFSLANIMILMTGTAVLLMFVRFGFLQFLSKVFQASMFVLGIWMGIQVPRTRPWIVWMASLQVLPFLWVIRQAANYKSEPNLLPLLTHLPVLFPAALIVNPNDEKIGWVMTLLTTAEFAIGLWLIYLGPKRTLAWGLVVVTFAVFSSFALNAVSRM